jgi:hypothetical protein
VAMRRTRPSVHSGSRLPGVSDKRLAVLVYLTIAATPVVAQDGPGNFEITPFGGYRFGGTFEITGSDESYELEDSASFGLLLDLREGPNTQWELLYSSQSTDAELNGTGNLQSVGLDTQVLQLGGTYQGSDDRFRPYVALTVGGTHVSSDADSDTFFSGSLGLGLQVLPSERIGIRLEARFYATLTDSNTDLFCRTGPDLNVCAVRVDGEILNQVETFAGVVFRF